ncbi:MAG: metallophosphoesterase family protein, partial [Verrucomicrobiales bacterium]
MQQSRRHFLCGSGALFVSSSLERLPASDAGDGGGTVLEQILSEAGFESNDPDSTLLAVVADLHINLDVNSEKYLDQFDDTLVTEINELNPPITDLVLAGDLIVHHSLSIGGSRYESHYERSRSEFRAVAQEVQRFRDGIHVRAVPGNHDTDRFEEDAELWREELDFPPYEKAVHGGVPVFYLNSGHVGLPDAAQRDWFEREVAEIPKDQEVLIVAHHPSFLYGLFETGVKRMVHDVLIGHEAPIWLIGGHGHAFAERLCVSGETQFIQMEATTANPLQWSDGRSPGYVLFALQGGRVLSRVFRSIEKDYFEARKSIGELTSYPVEWPIDSLDYPAVYYEEGFYDRDSVSLETDGVDLGSHYIKTSTYTVKVNLAEANGKICEFGLGAYINYQRESPTCYFSTTGEEGSWTGVALPGSDASNHVRVFKVEIPKEFRTAEQLYIRVRPEDGGISVAGWGLGGDPDLLTGYEKWLVEEYRTFLHNEETDPEAIPEGSHLTNLEHYAYRIPLPGSPGDDEASFSGEPTCCGLTSKLLQFQFARRSADLDPTVSYAVECSSDLTNWEEVEESALAIEEIAEDWEEVTCQAAATEEQKIYFRVRVKSSVGGTVSLVDADG